VKGVIFDIQRFSVHDGPGIRTTVFMKGCPLRCKWCHNPEGLCRNIQVQFFEEKCIGCKACGGQRSIEKTAVCPSQALKLCGREIEEDELIGELLRDRIFYADKGGVTFSGGECLLQADFVVSVLSRIKELGFTTAIDTSGYISTNEMRKTLSVCDLYLYDVKCIDPQVHKEYTGVDNALILNNLKMLSAEGKNIWVRVPVVPNFNNTESEMENIAEFVASLPNVKQVTLMPYHTLGASKYRTLGMEYSFDTTAKIAESEMSVFAQKFTDRGILLA